MKLDNTFYVLFLSIAILKATKVIWANGFHLEEWKTVSLLDWSSLCDDEAYEETR